MKKSVIFVSSFYTFISRCTVQKTLKFIDYFLVLQSFRSHYGSGVDSATNRNEYQVYFLG